MSQVIDTVHFTDPTMHGRTSATFTISFAPGECAQDGEFHYLVHRSDSPHLTPAHPGIWSFASPDRSGADRWIFICGRVLLPDHLGIDSDLLIGAPQGGPALFSGPSGIRPSTAFRHWRDDMTVKISLPQRLSSFHLTIRHIRDSTRSHHGHLYLIFAADAESEPIGLLPIAANLASCQGFARVKPCYHLH